MNSIKRLLIITCIQETINHCLIFWIGILKCNAFKFTVEFSNMYKCMLSLS